MIKLIKSTFFEEKKTKIALTKFITKANTLSMGEQCKLFESNFANHQDRKYCCFVNSGSSANLVLLQSLLNLGRIQKGAKIGFSSLTWSTNVMPIIQLGLIPVPIDVELETLNISSKGLSEVCSKEKITCLFITNLLGFCSDLDQISLFCSKNEIILIEDNCESLGSVLKNKKLGNFGLASTTSFFVGHHLSTIEGGSVLTDDKELQDMLMITRAHGWSRNIDSELQSKLLEKHKIDLFYNQYSFYELGFNLRPTEINGFLGNNQLNYLDIMISKRQENFYLYKNAAKSNPNLLPLVVNHMDLVSNFAYPLVFKSKELTVSYIKIFQNNKIEIRPIVGGNITQQPFFKKYFGESHRMPKAEIIHENGFYIPNNPELTSSELKTITETISIVL
jgi:CDP-6-deoxy-D-xylo-4-hexulose-3-dehydrase